MKQRCLYHPVPMTENFDLATLKILQVQRILIVIIRP